MRTLSIAFAAFILFLGTSACTPKAGSVRDMHQKSDARFAEQMTNMCQAQVEEIAQCHPNDFYYHAATGTIAIRSQSQTRTVCACTGSVFEVCLETVPFAGMETCQELGKRSDALASVW